MLSKKSQSTEELISRRKGKTSGNRDSMAPELHYEVIGKFTI
jgi:hypothetical protein